MLRARLLHFSLLIMICLNDRVMTRIHSASRKLQSQAGLLNAAHAAGYSAAGFQEAEARSGIFDRLGRFAYALIFAPLVLAIAALVAVGMAI